MSSDLALIAGDIKLSYEELDNLILKLATHLHEKGIEKGQKVTFVALPDWKVVILFFALFRLGAIACPLSIRLPNIQEALDALDSDHFLTLDDLCFDKAPSISLSEFDEDQPATYLFTSGTTAAPKIACHSLGNHYYSALGLNAILGFTEEHSWLLSLPLFHVGGLAILFRCFLARATLVLPPASYNSVTHLSFVPTQLYRLNEPCSATILLGGSSIPHSLMQKAKEQKLKIHTSYALTEMSSTVTLDGALLPYRSLTLADDGEILVQGKTLFKGYYSKENIEGWFPTRDLGELAPDGTLKIIGRKDHLFISGGENIQPEEIESALLSLTGILQAVVVPYPDAEFGQRPLAYILDETKTYTLESIRSALEKKLPRFKLPTRLLPITEEFEDSKAFRQQLRNKM